MTRRGGSGAAAATPRAYAAVMTTTARARRSSRAQRLREASQHRSADAAEVQALRAWRGEVELAAADVGAAVDDADADDAAALAQRHARAARQRLVRDAERARASGARRRPACCRTGRGRTTRRVARRYAFRRPMRSRWPPATMRSDALCGPRRPVADAERRRPAR